MMLAAIDDSSNRYWRLSRLCMSFEGMRLLFAMQSLYQKGVPVRAADLVEPLSEISRWGQARVQALVVEQGRCASMQGAR